MENPTDNDVIKRWTEQTNTENGSDRPRKRPRKALENGRKGGQDTPCPEPRLTGARTRARTTPEYLRKVIVKDIVEVEE
jgi:hypothetical protein